MGRPKVGLALGSGGAKGFAHIGVLKNLIEAGIPIDFIAGSSMGALVGALYAAGHSHESLYKMAVSFDRNHYLDFTMPKYGMFSGSKLTSLIKTLTHQKTFADCQIPIQIVAANLINGQRIIFKEGYLYEAIRASISIPGIFVPVKKGEAILVDGGVIDRVPVTVAKAMGADIVIGVDVGADGGRPIINNVFDVIVQSIDIMQQEMVRLQEEKADLMIKPPVGHFNSKVFTNMDKIIKIGEDTARRQLESCRRLLEEWKER